MPEASPVVTPTEFARMLCKKLAEHRWNRWTHRGTRADRIGRLLGAHGKHGRPIDANVSASFRARAALVAEPTAPSPSAALPWKSAVMRQAPLSAPTRPALDLRDGPRRPGRDAAGIAALASCRRVSCRPMVRSASHSRAEGAWKIIRREDKRVTAGASPFFGQAINRALRTAAQFREFFFCQKFDCTCLGHSRSPLMSPL